MTKPATPERLADLRQRYREAQTPGARRALRRSILRTIRRMEAKPDA